jgi:hypothetical protein
VNFCVIEHVNLMTSSSRKVRLALLNTKTGRLLGRLVHRGSKRFHPLPVRRHHLNHLVLPDHRGLCGREEPQILRYLDQKFFQ